MTSSSADRFRDEVILVARILLVVLFVVFGWSKLANYSGTAGYMARVGAPAPSVAAVVAIVVEFFVGLAVVLGVWTRPLALLLAHPHTKRGLVAGEAIRRHPTPSAPFSSYAMLRAVMSPLMQREALHSANKMPMTALKPDAPPKACRSDGLILHLELLPRAAYGVALGVVTFSRLASHNRAMRAVDAGLS